MKNTESVYLVVSVPALSPLFHVFSRRCCSLFKIIRALGALVYQYRANVNIASRECMLTQLFIIQIYFILTVCHEFRQVKTHHNSNTICVCLCFHNNLFLVFALPGFYPSSL